MSLDMENKALYLNIIGTFLIKGLSMLLTLSMMPIYIIYFEHNVILGVWFSISSILNWIFLLDFGIGNGLRNKLVPAFYEDDKKYISQLIVSAYFFFFVISFFLLILGLGVIAVSDLNSFFNVEQAVISSYTLKKSISILFLGIIVQFFLSIVNSIYYAMEKNVVANFTMLCSTIIVFSFISLFSFHSLEGKLLAISFVQAFSIIIPLLISNIFIFYKKLNYVKFTIENINWKVKDEILKLGGKFFVIQIGLMFINSTNEIFITNLVGPECTVTYQLYIRIFFIIVTAESLLIQPMWSAFSKAYVSKKYGWLRKTYRRFFYIGYLSVLIGILVAFFFEDIIILWIGNNDFNITLKNAILFVILISEIIFINISTCIANSFSMLKCQLICVTIGIFIKFFCSLLLVDIYQDWTAIIIANIIALAPLLFFQTYFSKKMVDELVKNN